MELKKHWEHVYATKPTNTVSWFQEHAEQSVWLIQASGVPFAASIIDVGGGASTLVDDLLDRGYSNLSVLDLSVSRYRAPGRPGRHQGGVSHHLRGCGQPMAGAGLRAGHQRGVSVARAGPGHRPVSFRDRRLSFGQRLGIHQRPRDQDAGEAADRADQVPLPPQQR
ncbi:hypothetical protein THIX_30138 [Thiomonas sp. X19]|nr:hypothetical protein THIX_30138 [Thiomonas sp. X19]